MYNIWHCTKVISKNIEMVVYEELIHVGETVDENMIATKHACLYKNYVQKVVLAKMSEQ